MVQWEAMTPKMALQLAAPHTWPASICPALLGELYCLLAGYPMHAVEGMALLFACILMQSAVNTFNDYFDYVKGTDCAEDCVEASDAVLVYNHLNPVHALWLGIAFLGIAFLLALPTLLAAGPAALIVGAVGGAAVLCYSGGPLPLSYLPIGELVSGLVMGGLIPVGIMAAVTGEFHWEVLLAALPLVLGIALIMMTNNTCDVEKDLDARRRTLPVLLGRSWSLRLYRFIVLLWLVFLCFLPINYLGVWGLICPALLLLFARRSFHFLLSSPLVQARRVAQMKGILKANIFGNGAYLAALAAALLRGVVIHG